jgi:hypothetical protein
MEGVAAAASRLHNQSVSFKDGSKSDPLQVKPDGASFDRAVDS